MLIGINGFGRIGRLVLRELWKRKSIKIKHIIDSVNDSRSSIIGALSTMVVNKTQLKVYILYDNEWGYSCRMADLVSHVIKQKKE